MGSLRELCGKKVNMSVGTLFCIFIVFACGMYFAASPSVGTQYIVGPISMIVVATIMSVFPKIPDSIFKRKKYIDDLKCPNNREKFRYIVIAGATVLFGLFSDYVVFRINHTPLSRFEVLGVIGGSFSLIMKITMFVGNVAMRYILMDEDASVNDENKVRRRSFDITYAVDTPVEPASPKSPEVDTDKMNYCLCTSCFRSNPPGERL